MEINLQIKGLNYGYESRLVFENLSESFSPGITWVRGPNGAGKSTLLKLAGGALRPALGQIFLGEMDLDKDALAYRRNALLFAGDLPQFSWMMARELVEFYLSLYQDAQVADVETHLAAFGVLPLLGQSLGALSMGQQRKMMLSVALAVPCRLLLLDEPFNALDQAAIEYLRASLSVPDRLARQVILLTSHVEPNVPLRRHLDLQ